MDSEDSNSTATAPELPLSGPGGTLRRAREGLRMELAHVAAETRIPLRHLEAIEADDFESLPSRAYAIGFSRTFAKAVGLDPATITDAVRAELADGSMRRAAPSSSMEPGDPARLPSAGLAWAAAAAVVLLMIGAFAFYRSYFGAGTEPGSLLTPAPAATSPAPVAAAPTPTSAASGPVVLTALEDGVWLRLYEEGGARLVERTLAKGEMVTVPATAADPRINTGRPDALALTVGGQAVARLGDQPTTISGVPVSATALLARAAVTAPVPGAAPAAGAVVPAPQTRRVPLSAPARAPAAGPAPRETVPAAPEGDAAPATEAEPDARR